MLIRHLVTGIVLAFVTAVWAYAQGYSLFAMLGFYVLGGSLGVAASAVVSLVPLVWLPRQDRAYEPQGPRSSLP